MKKALILIDIQNDYFPAGNMELVGMEAAANNAKKILDFFREQGELVYHVQHLALAPQATFFIPDTLGVEIHDTVAPIGGEIVVEKHYPNSFRETTLQYLLQSEGVQELVICGAMSQMCIDTSVRAAFDLGFSNILIHDACATRDLEFNGTKVEAKLVHAAYMAALSYPFANVMSADEYLKR